MSATVISVSLSSKHSFSKQVVDRISLVEGYGVAGDAHFGKTVKHRSRVAKDPTQPNLRQVHLIHQELFIELSACDFDVASGQLGENITTQGIELLNLPRDTKLAIGDRAVIQITGLRNPCTQLDDFQAGLMKACLDHDEDGNLIRKAGVMGVVLVSGVVRPGDPITITLPPEPHAALERV